MSPPQGGQTCPFGKSFKSALFSVDGFGDLGHFRPAMQNTTATDSNPRRAGLNLDAPNQTADTGPAMNTATATKRPKRAKQPTTPVKTDHHVCEEMLTPIRVWAHANHGAVKSIAERLTQKTGKPVMRQTVGRWIHKDPAKRQQPTYGFGLLLAEAVRELQNEQRIALGQQQ